MDMKRILVLLAAGHLTLLTAHAQATISFNNRIAGILEAPVFGPELANPLLELHGNDAAGVPAGTTVYTGAKLSGSGFTAELWAMPLTASSFAPVPGATTTFRTGGGIGFIVPPAADTVIPDVLPGDRAMLQLRVWDNQGSTVNDWLTAASLGLDRGISDAFLSDPLGGTPLSGLPITSPNMTGLRSFNIAELAPVPEPKSMALTALAISAFAIWRRRQLAATMRDLDHTAAAN
jgi:hypothetical protein